MPARRNLRTIALAPAGTADQTVLAAPTDGLRIYVIGYTMVASAATVVTWKSGAATNLSGGMSLALNGGVSAYSGDSDTFLFATNPGDALVINQTVDGVDGHVVCYVR